MGRRAERGGLVSGAKKQAALRHLADQASEDGLGLVAAALTQIAKLDLENPTVCERWNQHLRREHGDTTAPRDVVLRAARRVLRATVSAVGSPL